MQGCGVATIFIGAAGVLENFRGIFEKEGAYRNDTHFVEGFVTCTLIICIGPWL